MTWPVVDNVFGGAEDTRSQAPMPVLSCPNCGEMTPRELEASRFATVNYYRCGNCAHVWTTDKKTNEILTHVTPLWKKQPSDRV